jgi:hypothetical protein
MKCVIYCHKPFIVSSANCWLWIESVTYGTLYEENSQLNNDNLKAKIKAIIHYLLFTRTYTNWMQLYLKNYI